MRTLTFKFFLAILFVFTSCNKDKYQIVKNEYLLSVLDRGSTGVDFYNTIIESEDHSIINYIYNYNGGGVAAGDINNDGLPDLYFISNQGDNQLFLNKGNLKFENITYSAGVSGEASWSSGVTMVDVNSDGLLDIYVCNVSQLLNFQGKNELFINNGDNTFTERSQDFGLDFQGYSTQSYFFDYDKDGDLDMYLVNHAIHTTLSHGSASVRNNRVPLVGDVLFRNDDGYYNDVSETANIYGGVNSYGLSVAILDINNDGWEDIYVCNDFHEDDYLYLNNRNGTFTEKLGDYFSTISRFSMGSDAADFNNDGYVDLITLDMLPFAEDILKQTEGDDFTYNMRVKLQNLGYKDQYSRNMLQDNHNGNYFIESAIMNNVASTDWSWSALFADFNNDRHDDLYITNGILRRPNDLDFKNYVANSFKGRSEVQGLKWLYNSINEMPSGKAVNQIFKGSSSGFDNVTGKWVLDTVSLSNGAVYVDLDVDGDLDLVVNNLNSYADIFENRNLNHNYLQIELKYIKENHEGIGAKVVLYDNLGSQTKWLNKSRGFLSSVEGILQFGLGESKSVDSILVIWPDLSEQLVKVENVNQRVQITYDQSKLREPSKFKSNNALRIFDKVEPFTFDHIENSAYDFLKERLMPYRVSMRDPAYAIGDVDGDGSNDIFIGNSSGNRAKLFINRTTSFDEMELEVLLSDSDFEDSAALFFDADSDGDQDLYVASGLGIDENSSYDRLYMNINGKFHRTKNNIPKNIFNTSVVITEDYDKDGDLDLFVGNHSVPHKFGEKTYSYVLINDGVGHFIKDTTFELEGFTTDAVWFDINDDGWKDLIVATEWAEPKIFYNNEGNLKKYDVSNQLKGLWQAVEIYDADKDGDLDIALGNYGLNTKFSLTDLPIHMYYSDFDNNGIKEVVTSYTSKGKEYPINSRQEIISQMNIFARIYNSNMAFSGQTMQNLFGEDRLSKSSINQVNYLASGYLENNNGQFDTFVPFERELQVAPIRVFELLEENQNEFLLIFGNALDVNTFHGGYKSLKGFIMNSAMDFRFLSDFGVDPVNNQIVGATSINFGTEKLLILISNGEKVETYRFKSIDEIFRKN